jgi:hypothetical protein
MSPHLTHKLDRRRHSCVYLSPIYDEQRNRSLLTRDAVVARAERIRERLLREFSPKRIMLNRLDNPYMTDLARMVLVNDMRRKQATCRAPEAFQRKVTK